MTNSTESDRSHRFKIAAPVTVITACLLLPLAGYVTGYLLLGKKGFVGDGITICRVYESAAISTLFTPAAAVEGWMTGCDVVATHYDD